MLKKRRKKKRKKKERKGFCQFVGINFFASCLLQQQTSFITKCFRQLFSFFPGNLSSLFFNSFVSFPLWKSFLFSFNFLLSYFALLFLDFFYCFFPGSLSYISSICSFLFYCCLSYILFLLILAFLLPQVAFFLLQFLLLFLFTLFPVRTPFPMHGDLSRVFLSSWFSMLTSLLHCQPFPVFLLRLFTLKLISVLSGFMMSKLIFGNPVKQDFQQCK